MLWKYVRIATSTIEDTTAKLILDDLSRSDLAGTFEYAHACSDYALMTAENRTEDSLPNAQKDSTSQPLDLVLEQNTPNPLNPSTVIGFILASPGFVTLKIYDMLGREVAVLVNDSKTSGSHRVMCDASRCASGIYFARIEASGKTAIRKLLLVK